MKDYLPIGSVVTLKEGTKKLMIYGVKQTNLQTNEEYDYLAVLYPEGNVGLEYQYLFNYDEIENIHFKGFESEEMDYFKKMLSNLPEKPQFK